MGNFFFLWTKRPLKKEKKKDKIMVEKEQMFIKVKSFWLGNSQIWHKLETKWKKNHDTIYL